MSQLPPICSHSTLGHLLHPFCSSLPLWRRVATVAIPVLVIALWANSRRSQTPRSLGNQFEFFGVKIQRLSDLERRAFEETKQRAETQRSILGFNETHKPKNPSIPKIAALLKRQKEELVGLLQHNGWGEAVVQAKANTIMNIAYVLAYLTLDENTPPNDHYNHYLRDDRYYAGDVVLGCLSLYHVIRSRGSIQWNQDGQMTYLGGDQINSDSNDAYRAELYNTLVGKLRTAGFVPDAWPKFKSDDSPSYECPLTSLREDLITPEMKTVLNDLLGGTYTLDNLPVYRGTYPMTVKAMENWVLQGVHEGRPFVAIKMRCSKNKSENIVFLSCPHHMNYWMQLVNLRGQLFPSFFSDLQMERYFTIKGEVPQGQTEIFEQLKTIIKEGYGQDACGETWEIIGHPNAKLNPAKIAQINADGICLEVRTILDDLLGDNRSIDDLPVLERYKDLLPTVGEVEKPIMKFRGTGFAPPAGIVIKLRFSPERAGGYRGVHLVILAQENSDNPCKWTQRKSESGLSPKLFETFTDEKGELDDYARASFILLKRILQNGRGVDRQGNDWELVAE